MTPETWEVLIDWDTEKGREQITSKRL